MTTLSECGKATLIVLAECGLQAFVREEGAGWSACGHSSTPWLAIALFCTAKQTTLYLVQFSGRVLGDQLLQAAPVSPWHLLGDATAPLQIQLVHLLAYVVPQHCVITPNLLLEC